eukprot:8604803-Ditylum_brightwellii.AAC.1
MKNELLYGDDNKVDLSGNMISKHKSAASKECMWHNKISNVKNKDVTQALKQISLYYSPASVHDAAEVLLEKMHERGGISMSTDDAVGLLETE